MFSRCDKLMDNDPFEELFALNLGDFLTEHLISEELATKIKKKDTSASENLKQQLSELVSIYSINNTLNVLGLENRDDYVVYNAIAKTIIQMVDVNACHIFLSKERMRGKIEKDLFLAGTSCPISEGTDIYKLGYDLSKETNIAKVFENQEISHIDISNDSNVLKELINPDNKSAILFPMKHHGVSVGVIVIERDTEDALAKEYFELIISISNLLATSLTLQTLTEEASAIISIENQRTSILKSVRAELTVTIGDLGDEQQRFVEKLAETVDYKGAYSRKHSEAVANIAKKLATQLGLNEKTKDLIYYAALLQNIGRIILPQELFEKKEQLTEFEIEKFKKAPNFGVNILMQINFLSEVIPYVHYHKERWDGKGLPEGLKGRSIPFGSRIIAVADAYCALLVERPYRKSFSDTEAMEIIKNEAGIKWDPDVVNALCEIDRS